ncbi:MAG: hypothetical protein IKS72_05610, partial [Prevotella sp.]|nr:hypothetical protein [Prevotella sp.]
NDEDGYVSDASNYNFSDEATLDKHGYVENSNNGCKRIGIITSYVYVSSIFREFMEQPIRKKVISDEW